jgi:hypothetical protein
MQFCEKAVFFLPQSLIAEMASPLDSVLLGEYRFSILDQENQLSRLKALIRCSTVTAYYTGEYPFLSEFKIAWGMMKKTVPEGYKNHLDKFTTEQLVKIAIFDLDMIENHWKSIEISSIVVCQDLLGYLSDPPSLPAFLVNALKIKIASVTLSISEWYFLLMQL